MSESETQCQFMSKAALQKAVAFVQQERLTEAADLLLDILLAHPEEPNALFLFAVVRANQGKDDEAKTLYLKSLSANPRQAQVYINLSILLRKAGDFGGAIENALRAIELNPSLSDAHVALSHAFHDQGSLKDAEKSIRKALKLQPNDALAGQSLAAILNDAGRPGEAEILLRRLLALPLKQPDTIAELKHNLGVSLSLQFRYREAIKVFDDAQRQCPQLKLAHTNKGDAFQNLKEYEAAIQSYRSAVAQDPLNIHAHNKLNHLLYRSRRDEEFLNSFDEAIAKVPTAGELPLAKAKFLLLKDDLGGAQQALESAALLLNDNTAALEGLAQVHAKTGKFDIAISNYEIVVNRMGSSPNKWIGYADILMRAGDPRKASEVCEKAIGLAPNNQGAWAYLGIALEWLGDSRAELLNGYDDLVQVYNIEPPKGYDDARNFNSDLRIELEQLHSDQREMIDQSLRNGTQTLGDLFGRDHVLANKLRTQLNYAIEAYIQGLNRFKHYEVSKRRSNAFSYAGSWSSRLTGCGYHTNHYHAQGWLSSVYYVSVPKSTEDETTKEGWIKFGQPVFDNSQFSSIKRAIRPQPGNLVLFPSYMWHGTIPFLSEQPRLTVAFDVLPA